MRFEWIDFYMEFADALMDFKCNRNALIEKIQKVYATINMKVPKIESGDKIIDIDPFTVFGLFNKGITDANRISIIGGIADEFEIKAKIPNNFAGIPVLNNFKATFYYFKEERAEDDIDNLWDIFEAALILSDSDTEQNRQRFLECYDKVHDQLGIRWNITMGLYWVRPYTFINLDSRNRWYITNSDNMPAEFVEAVQGKLSKVPDAADYLAIKDLCQIALSNGEYEYKNFPELSYYAWMISEQVNQAKVTEEKQNTNSKAAFLRWFNPLIQALRDLGGSATPPEARKKIIENEQLTEEEISITRGKSNVNKFENEVAFARNYLVSAGYIDKSVYGVWTLTEAGRIVDMNEERASDIFRKVISENQNKSGKNGAALVDEDVNTTHYWIYSPGDSASMWDEFYKLGIMAIGWGEIGDLRAFTSKDEMKAKMKETYDANLSYKNAAHATWQFANEMKIGDIVFVKKGMHQLVGRGVVISDYEYDDNRTDEYNHIRRMNWTHNGEWAHPGQAVMKTLTEITSYTEYVEKLNMLFETDSEEDIEEVKSYPIYTEEDFLEEVYMPGNEYSSLVAILKNKKNVILQGAPGVGKTFAAKRLAYSIMGVKDIDRVAMVQFHQSYSYEDFIMGFRPSDNGFDLKKGVFYNFCKKAEIDTDNDYFFIIDEINRGNLSKIFGELFMLIENDKRGISLQMLYSDEKFAVPKNVHIIGMMNTADRSLAILDYALRRRFAFFEIRPGFETDGFREYRMGLDNDKFNRLISCVENLNHAIAADESLGEGFCIGHSYFCNLEVDTIDDQCLSGIVEYELIPLLKEYWFDEPQKVKDWSNSLRSAIK